MFRILSVRPKYSGWLNLLSARLVDPQGVETHRHIIELSPAVAVLPYDPVRRTALVVSMPRAPVLYAEQPEMIEAIAGSIDSDDPAECGRREAMEEAGARLSEMDHIGRIWTMPSNATERIDYYLASYGAADRVAAGGGLDSEQENITVHEPTLAELWSLHASGRLFDGKLLILLLALRIKRPDLFP